MKQNIYIAALLAGMLALAGCGGGGSPSNEPPPPPADDTTVSLPKPIDGTSLDGAPTTIKAGEEDVPIGGLYFSCPAGGKDCVVTVPEDRRANKVNFTGAKPKVSAAKTPAVVTTQTNSRQGDSNDPLSSANLLAAVLKTTPFGAKDRNALEVGNPTKFALLDKTNIDLWLRTMAADNDDYKKDGDYIYYAIWTETADQGNSPTAPKPKYRWDWGGGMPYGAKPDASLTATGTAASYRGDALLFHKVAPATGFTALPLDSSVTLMANFAGGWIKGHVDILPVPNITSDRASRINLATAMYSSDTFSGTAEFSNGDPGADPVVPNTLKGKGNGSWKGQFFGDSSLTIIGGAQSHQAPSHVAGEFAVSRNAVADNPATTGVDETITGLSITGVFGANSSP